MYFNVSESLKRVAKELNTTLDVVETFIRGDLGTRWIIDKKLKISEVELAMLIKTIRKRLAFEFNNAGTLEINEATVTKQKKLEKLSSRYKLFYKLHKDFYSNGKSYKQIEGLLHKNKIIFEGGISSDDFFKLLPVLLSNISPEELELSYLINTLFRQEIALFIEKESGLKLYVRGSLLFFNSHSFGNGYLANFCHEKINYKELNTYFPLQGSDLDLKYGTKKILSAKLNKVMENIRKEINKQLEEYNNYLTIELAPINQAVQDSVWEVKGLQTLQNIFISESLLLDLRQDNYFREYYTAKERNIPLQKHKLLLQLRSSKRVKKIEKKKIMLGIDGILWLTQSFELTMKHFRVNKSLSEEFTAKWNNKLSQALMETDFFGYIDKEQLFSAFKSTFLFSGYRFSKKEERLIFNKIIEYYFRLRE